MTLKPRFCLLKLSPLVFISVLSGLSLKAQVSHSAIDLSESGFYLLESVSNTQFPAYADNAIGLTGALYVQPNQWLGLELRGSTFPVSARFALSPMQVGIRTAPRFGHYNAFGFLGGGLSYAEDSGRDWHTRLPAQFVPAWQASIGLDHRFRRVSWRIAEISDITTYTPTHTLHSLTAGTGLVIRITAH